MLHLVGRALPGNQPFRTPSVAWWFWGRLRRVWPDALAACLMPDHVHLIVPDSNADACRLSMARLLGRTAARVRAKRLFDTVPRPSAIPDVKHLGRQIRYVHLNPSRAGLVRDPLSWPLSTHRGAIGAELDPWVSGGRLSLALRRPGRDFPKWLHAYVSGDPSVAPEGTPFPSSAEPRLAPVLPLDVIVAAAFVASPWSPPAARRQLAVALAQHQGWRDFGSIATAVGISACSARRLFEHRHPSLHEVGALCLGDPRLCFAPIGARALVACPRPSEAPARRALRARPRARAASRLRVA
jgi:hypothetical protein